MAPNGDWPLPAYLVAALLALLAASLAPAASADALLPLSSYASNVTLEADVAYFYWSIEEGDNSIRMAVRVRTQGWVALGVSEVGAMVGSDVMLGWVENGMAMMTDRFIFNKSLDASGVALDQSQDVRITAGGESQDSNGDTWTTLHFWRYLNTSDCNDRPILPGQHVSLIWAMGSSDTLSWHGALNRGGTTLILYPGSLFGATGRQAAENTTASPGPAPGTAIKSTSSGRSLAARASLAGAAASGAAALDSTAVFTDASAFPLALARRGLRTTKVQAGLQAQAPAPAPGGAPPSRANPGTLVQTEEWLNMTATSYTVPFNSTTYACNAFNLTYTEKKHITEFGVIISSTNPEMLHHAVVYACTGQEKPDSWQPNFECYSQGGCFRYFAVWALGGRPVKFPAPAGMPVGPGGYTTLILQVHYTNPDGLTTAVDSSGMYFRVAPTLRPYDAGILEMGPAFFPLMISIPPRKPVWTQETYCPTECTSRLANTTDGVGPNITVFASLMHQHEMGKQLYTDLYRDGQKVLTVGRQDYYDFAFQQFQDLSPGFNVLPGDELGTRCVFDSSNRTQVTPGGFASDQEMCFNYLLYYPLKSTFVGPCFKFCTPRDGKTGPLVPVAACAQDVIPVNGTCPAQFSDQYGSDSVPFETQAGCPSLITPSLSTLNMTAISVAASPGTLPPGGSPPTSSGCSAVSANGEAVSSSKCLSLEGGFSLMWNVSSAGSDGLNPGSVSGIGVKASIISSPNVTLSMRFSGTSPGYIAFGFSPTGGMIGSSAFAGWTASSGPTVAPLYLGGISPSMITRGNNIQVLGSSLETTPSDGGNTNITILVSLSMPATMAISDQNLVWSKGMVVDDFLSQHKAEDAHKGVLLAIDCTQSQVSPCDMQGLSLPPPPKAATRDAVTVVGLLVYILMALLLA